MEVEWPPALYFKEGPQESVVERSSSRFQEIFSTPLREPIIGAIGTVFLQQIGNPAPQYPLPSVKAIS